MGLLRLPPRARRLSDYQQDMTPPPMLAHALSPEVVKASLCIGLKVGYGHMEGGKYVEEWSGPAHSWVQAIAASLVTELSNTVQTALGVDTGNTARTRGNGRAFQCAAAAADITKGIVAGTGTTAVAITDYVLVTPIAEGIGAGQLNYQAMVFAALGVSGNNRLITMTRSLQNNSGGNITLGEVALYGKTFDTTAYRTFCFARDLLTLTINAGQAKTITYTATLALT